MGFENGNDSTGTIPTHLMGGVDIDGKVKAIAVATDGTVQVSSSGGGGDASASNQTEEIEQLIAINEVLGNITDTPGQYNQSATAIALLKRIQGVLGTDIIEDDNQSTVQQYLQQLSITASDTYNSLGQIANTTASSDTGNSTLIAFIKRLLSIKLPSTLSNDRFKVEVAFSTSSTPTSISSSTSNQVLLAANANRKGATIFNNSTANLFIEFGATATTSVYTVKLSLSSQYYEVPFGYTGVISGIWDSANGNANVRELT